MKRKVSSVESSGRLLLSQQAPRRAVPKYCLDCRPGLDVSALTVNVWSFRMLSRTPSLGQRLAATMASEGAAEDV